ncbi:MAG: 4Fe-4S binding protein [Alphaproteobacteria bacterium]|nr:4Fe-4S binding protein [Alphaproteobacteria bacterium]
MPPLIRHWAGTSIARQMIGLAGAVLVAVPALARDAPPPGPGGTYVERYLLDYVVPKVLPGADRRGEVEGDPPAIPLYRGETLLGYGFDTWDVVAAVGFSRKPFHVLAGFDLDGRLTGAHLAWHLEPITLLGRKDSHLQAYLEQLVGLDIGAGVQVMFDGATRNGTRSAATATIDGISRVTITSMLFVDAIMRGARLVARGRGVTLQTLDVGRRLDLESYQAQSWPEMIADGSLGYLSVTNREMGAASGESEAVAAELWVALLNPAGIGVNLLGRRGYRSYSVGRSLADSGVFVAAAGDFMAGPDPAAGMPPAARLHIVQGARRIPLTADRFEPVLYLDGLEQPDGFAQGMFHLAAADGLVAARPWRLEVTVADQAGDTDAVFAIDYRLPDRYLKGAPLEPGADPLSMAGDVTLGSGMVGAFPGPDWRAEWRAQQVGVIILGASLVGLLVILLLQDAIVRRPRLFLILRLGFMAWTAGWIGWVAGAQLSVIHVLNWIQSVAMGIDWEFFLMEPLIFVLTAFVVVSAVLWGRAAFCGWLCPFGAMQELLNRLARRLGVAQFRLSAALAQRLVAVKYLIFLILVGLTFYSIELAYAATAIEPFKTAITFRFDAPWPAVAYALALLGIAMTIERFYCRFVCPLGAGLAILGRLNMFDWLKRRVDCGNPCGQCNRICPVGAILNDGSIDMNECFYCLDCQVVYYDSHQCPPLIKRRKRAAAALAA